MRSVIKGASLGYWDFNDATGEYFVDDNWLKMLGLEAGDIDFSDPDDWQRLIHPDDRVKLMNAVSTALRTQQAFTLEFRMMHKDGRVVWIQSCGAVVEWDHQHNRPLRNCGTHLDITELKHNEEEKEQYKQFFHIAPDVKIILNPLGAMLKVNPAACRILGYTEEELLSRPFMDFVYEPDRQRTQAAVTDHLQQGHTLNFENRYVCKDGSLRWISWNSSYDPREGITYATGRDITSLKETEEKLRGQEQINRALIENSEDMIVLYGRDHSYLYVNPSLERALGISREELVGSNRTRFEFPPELQNFWRNTIESVFTTGQSATQVYEMDTPTGRMKLLWNAFPGLRGSDGAIHSVFGVSHDITEHVRAEEELQKIERLESLGILAGGIAHDFNNILTILFGNIAAAKSQLDKPKQALAALDNAEKALDRSSFLTNQLLTFAKGGEPMTAAVDIEQLVRDTVTFDLSDSDVKLEVRAAGQLWITHVDAGQVAQVFSNLAINANQAMPKGGTLYIAFENREIKAHEIRGLAAGRYIQARVRDEGMGINAGELSRIFDPYYSTKQAGSGLGLTMVYSIVTRHKGNIAVVSAPGQGTTFEILLPAALANAPEQTADEQIAVPEKHGNYRVLVMDDEPMICELAEGILEREGYRVDAASDGAEAVDMVKKVLGEGSRYDCIIMDLTIPGGMGGKDAVAKVLELDPAAKVIVSSGYAVDPVMANFMAYGFKGAITKPFSIKMLSDEVRRLSRDDAA